MELKIYKNIKEIDNLNKNKIINLYNTFLFLSLDFKQIDYFLFNKYNTNNFEKKEINIIEELKGKYNNKYYIKEKKEIKIYSIFEIEKIANKKYCFKFIYSFNINYNKAYTIFNYLINFFFIKNKNFNIFLEENFKNLLDKNIIGYKIIIKNLKNILKEIKELKKDINNFNINFNTENTIKYLLKNKDLLKDLNLEKYYIFIYYNPLSSCYLDKQINLNKYNIMYLKNIENLNNIDYLLNYIRKLYNLGKTEICYKEILVLFNYLYTSNIELNNKDNMKLRILKYLTLKYFYKQNIKKSIIYKNDIFLQIIFSLKYKKYYQQLELFFYKISKQFFIDLNKIIDNITKNLIKENIYLYIIEQYNNDYLFHYQYSNLIKNIKLNDFIVKILLPFKIYKKDKNNYLNVILTNLPIYKKIKT